MRQQGRIKGFVPPLPFPTLSLAGEGNLKKITKKLAH